LEFPDEDLVFENRYVMVPVGVGMLVHTCLMCELIIVVERVGRPDGCIGCSGSIGLRVDGSGLEGDVFQRWRGP
jgi:hypothetical protein